MPLTPAQLTTPKAAIIAGSSIFDNVSSGEASAGDMEYRCVYVKNHHGSLTLTSPKIWIQANTPSGDTAVEISLCIRRSAL